MKKVCLFLVIILSMSMVACGVSEADPSNSTTEAASTLSAEDLSCSESGTIEDFWAAGTITSNYSLDRIECTGSITSNDGNIRVSDEAEPFTFEDNVYSVDLSTLNEYFIKQCSTLYELYAMANMDDTNNSLNVKFTCECYDLSANSISFTIDYVINAE